MLVICNQVSGNLLSTCEPRRLLIYHNIRFLQKSSTKSVLRVITRLDRKVSGSVIYKRMLCDQVEARVRKHNVDCRSSIGCVSNFECESRVFGQHALVEGVINEIL